MTRIATYAGFGLGVNHPAVAALRPVWSNNPRLKPRATIFCCSADCLRLTAALKN